MKKGLQTTALLISAILLARSVASAKEANLLTGMYWDIASTNSVSDGDSSTIPPTHEPDDISVTNPPADTPDDIPETNPPADTPDDIPETDPPIEFSPDTDLQEEVPTSVLSITAPNSLDFIIDPYELAGKGSIWSQEYDFVNEGNVPVKISLSKLHCRAADDVTIAESEESISDDGKTAALWLYLGDGHRIQITESDTSYEFTLEPEEALIFWIKGKISANNKWRNGDLGLSVLYRLEAAGSEE